MENNFLLSIVIPVFNGEMVINRCIESIVSEPCNEYEIIIIDDGSTDGTGRLCEEWSVKDSRIHYFRQENAGVSAARNRGIIEAHGEYIMFLDADDYLKEEWWIHIDKPLTGMKKYDIIFFDYFKEINRRNIPIKIFDNCSDILSGKDVIEKYVYTEDINAPWAKLFKRNIIIENNIRFPEGMKVGEDAVFLSEVLKKTKEYLYIPEHLMVYYYDNPSSAMHIVPKKIQTLETMFKKKNEVFLYYQKDFELMADRFYGKQLMDFFTLLRNYAKALNVKKFCGICRQSMECVYIRDLTLSINDKKVKSFRRRMQYFLYKNRMFTILYMELLIENFVKRGKPAGNVKGQ